MASRTPENEKSPVPREAPASAGPSAFIPVRHLVAMAFARIRCLLPGGEKARLRRAMRTALGHAVSAQELNRLAAAAAVYQALARADRAAPGRLLLAHLPVNLAQGTILLVPLTPFQTAMQKAVSTAGIRVVYTPAPRHDHEAFQRAISAIPPGAPLVGLYPHRTGPVAVVWRGRTFPEGLDEREIAEFADGCLADNPAQYGWLEEKP